VGCSYGTGNIGAPKVLLFDSHGLDAPVSKAMSRSYWFFGAWVKKANLMRCYQLAGIVPQSGLPKLGLSD